MTKNKILTKSKYLIGMQSHKWLWTVFNEPDKIPEPDKFVKQKLETGDLIGELAKKLYPEGIDVPIEDFNENLNKSKELILQRKICFESSFLSDNIYSRADILVPAGEDEWDIVEVKSATKVKDLNVHDVAFQRLVYEKCGLKIRKCFLMHINNEYVRKGQIEPKELFVQTEITEEVSIASEGIEKRIKEMFEVINSEKCPDFHIDDLVTIEYDNVIKDEFLDSLPEESVFELYRGGVKSRNLYKEGIIKIKDIPENFKLTPIQKIQRECSLSGKCNVNKTNIKKFIEELKYPLYYLDFETINPAIPLFDNMKPYVQIPFQYSLHIVEEKGLEPKHISFLADGIDNPIPKFLQSLKDNLGEEGDIIVYYEGFEKSRLKEGAELFSEFDELINKNFIPRIKDLLVPFKNFDYYDPKQKGSASLKKVLPVMSNLSYKNLSIGNGADASLEYERITFKENVSEQEKQKIREALEKYCELDTLAEVKIVEKLGELLKNG